MYIVRKQIFRLRPLCQIFWALSNNSKKICTPYVSSFRDPALVIYQTRIQKKLHPAKALPGICCATAVHCPGLPRGTGLVASISYKSISKYLVLLKIRH